MDLSKFDSSISAPAKCDFTRITFSKIGSSPITYPLNNLAEIAFTVIDAKDFPLLAELQKESTLPLLLDAMAEQGFETSVEVDLADYEQAMTQYDALIFDFKNELVEELGIDNLPNNIGYDIIDEAWRHRRGNPFESTVENARATVAIIQPLIESHHTLTDVTEAAKELFNIINPSE